MIIFTLLFIAGIAAFSVAPYFPVALCAIGILSVVCLFVTHSLQKGGSKRTGRVRIVILIVVFTSGVLYSLVREESLPEIIFPDHDLTVEGTIVNVPQMSRDRLRFRIDNVAVEGKGIHGSVRLVIFPEMFGNDVNSNLLDPGNRISAIAKLREPSTFLNPGVYSKDLKRAGIAAVGYVKNMQIIAKKDGFMVRISKKRQHLGRILENSLTAENASFHKAIIPGLKMGMSQEMRDAFSSTGLAHLLSISGTHFGLLAFLFFSIIRSFVKKMPVRYLARMTLYITPTQIAVILTLPVLCVYAVISGLSTPTLRSFIMVSMYMLALLLGRRDLWLHSLSIAAVIILLWQPAALFELSFMLSFLAVLSIGYVMEKRAESEGKQNTEGMKRGIKKFSEKVITGSLITAAAVLGTAPIVVLYFKQFPLVSPVTNLVVAPLVCFVILPLGFVSSFSAFMLSMTSMPLSGIIDAVTYFAMYLIRLFARFPFSSVHVHNPSVVTIVLYYVSLLFIIKSSSKWRWLPLVIVLGIYLGGPHLSGNNMKITFLDVGQGDAAVVELPDGKVMLIDGSTGEPDMGRMVIAPYLWSKGIQKIDYMVMSHPHPDHYGGLMYIAESFDVGEVWFNGGITAAGMADLFQDASNREIPLNALRRGDLLERDSYKVYVFHPYEKFNAASPRGEFSDQNSNSLVLKIEAAGRSVLFTGDIESEAEESLIYLDKWLESDIMKMPHHGGRTSSSGAFIRAVNPQIAVASFGKNNPFQHPHEETLERYRSAGVTIFRTAVDGAITITFNDNSYEIERYQDSRFIKVTDWSDEIRNLMMLL